MAARVLELISFGLSFFKRPEPQSEVEPIKPPVSPSETCEHFTPSKPITIKTPTKAVRQRLLPLHNAAPAKKRTQVLATAESDCAIGSYDSGSDTESSPQSTQPSSAGSSPKTGASSIATQYNTDVILAETYNSQRKRMSPSISSRRSSPSKPEKPLRPLSVYAPLRKMSDDGAAASDLSSEYKPYTSNDSLLSPDFFNPKQETRAAEKMFKLEAQLIKLKQALKVEKTRYATKLSIGEDKNDAADVKALCAQRNQIEVLQQRVRQITQQSQDAHEEHAVASEQLRSMTRRAFDFEHRPVW